MSLQSFLHLITANIFAGTKVPNLSLTDALQQAAELENNFKAIAADRVEQVATKEKAIQALKIKQRVLTDEGERASRIAERYIAMHE